MKKQAQKLVVGDQFRNSVQKPWRTIKKIIVFKQDTSIPKIYEGKIIFIVDNCKQILVEKEHLLFVNHELIESSLNQ
jgi:hypothetical protein